MSSQEPIGRKKRNLPKKITQAAGNNTLAGTSSVRRLRSGRMVDTAVNVNSGQGEGQPPLNRKKQRRGSQDTSGSPAVKRQRVDDEEHTTVPAAPLEVPQPAYPQQYVFVFDVPCPDLEAIFASSEFGEFPPQLTSQLVSSSSVQGIELFSPALFMAELPPLPESHTIVHEPIPAGIAEEGMGFGLEESGAEVVNASSDSHESEVEFGAEAYDEDDVNTGAGEGGCHIGDESGYEVVGDERMSETGEEGYGDAAADESNEIGDLANEDDADDRAQGYDFEEIGSLTEFQGTSEIEEELENGSGVRAVEEAGMSVSDEEEEQVKMLITDLEAEDSDEDAEEAGMVGSEEEGSRVDEKEMRVTDVEEAEFASVFLGEYGGQQEIVEDIGCDERDSEEGLEVEEVEMSLSREYEEQEEEFEGMVVRSDEMVDSDRKNGEGFEVEEVGSVPEEAEVMSISEGEYEGEEEEVEEIVDDARDAEEEIEAVMSVSEGEYDGREEVKEMTGENRDAEEEFTYEEAASVGETDVSVSRDQYEHEVEFEGMEDEDVGEEEELEVEEEMMVSEGGSGIDAEETQAEMSISEGEYDGREEEVEEMTGEVRDAEEEFGYEEATLVGEAGVSFSRDECEHEVEFEGMEDEDEGEEEALEVEEEMVVSEGGSDIDAEETQAEMSVSGEECEYERQEEHLEGMVDEDREDEFEVEGMAVEGSGTEEVQAGMSEQEEEFEEEIEVDAETGVEDLCDQAEVNADEEGMSIDEDPLNKRSFVEAQQKDVNKQDVEEGFADTESDAEEDMDVEEGPSPPSGAAHSNPSPPSDPPPTRLPRWEDTDDSISDTIPFEKTTQSTAGKGPKSQKPSSVPPKTTTAPPQPHKAPQAEPSTSSQHAPPQNAGSAEPSATHESKNPSTSGGDFPPPPKRAYGNDRESLREMLLELILLIPDQLKKNEVIAAMKDKVFLYADLHALIGRACIILNIVPVDCGNSSTKPKSGKTFDKHGFPKIKRRAQAVLDLSREVRLEISRLTQPKGAPLVSISSEQRKDWQRSRYTSGGPTIRAFVLDLTSRERWKDNKWNQQATQVFADYFVGLEGNKCYTKLSVTNAFKTHLRSLQKQYLKDNSPFSNHKEVHMTDRRGMRRRNHRKRRVNMIRASAVNNETMKRFVGIAKHFTIEMMSGEETETEKKGKSIAKTHRSLVQRWRSSELDEFLRLLDALHISTRYIESTAKYSPGQFPCYRTPSTKPDAEYHPEGLPKNWYDKAYLDEVPGRRQQLKVQPPVPLRLPDHVLRTARRFLHVRSRKDLPLDPNQVSLD
ncbi:hypothetical protein AAF712_012042 [Marasmius tenuissimus]|uniref:Uncharacterized protein n=1 Tax=Marasmius tenuissimus TaxID=585030 RepID=A0ABR2ZKY7_9AGAR